MSKPEADPSSGTSLGDALRLPKRHPACRRREAQSGSCAERENLAGDDKGEGASGSNREAESTDAPERGGLSAATIILAGQRQLSWPVGSPANAGCREGRSPDRRLALAGDGGFKIPWRGRPPFGVEGGIAAHSTNRMSLDAEPSCDRPPGDALHDPFPTTRPGIRRGHGRLQRAHRAPHR